MPIPVSNYVPQCAPTDTLSRRSPVAWLIVTGGAFALLALVLLAPITLARGHSFLSYVMYGIFRAVCHQMPERSFHVEG
nr:hypothetical protein [Pyrinomonadaceae bacterium]